VRAREAGRRRTRSGADLRRLALERNPVGRALLFRKAREAVAAKTGGHYPAAERVIDVLQRFGNRGFDASAQLEARFFGELCVSETSHRLIELFFARTALKKDVGADDPSVIARPIEEVALTTMSPELVLAQVAAEAPHPEAVVGLRSSGALVEVERGDATASWAVVTTVAHAKREGKTCIVVKGPYTSRILERGAAEAARIVGEGVPAEAVDGALVAWGWPSGAFPLPAPASAQAARAVKLPAEEIQMRCTLQLVNEAIACFREGVLRSARDGDVAAVVGLGFPPFRGGPFRYTDSIGAAEILRRVLGYEDRYGPRWSPAPLLVEMAKSGKRFYDDA
jgi:3-hydroxyacyl-CoA dehydrogenase